MKIEKLKSDDTDESSLLLTLAFIRIRPEKKFFFEREIL